MSFLGNLLGLGGAGDSLSQSMGLGGTQNNTSGVLDLGNATEGGGGLLGLNLFGVDNSMRLPLALSMMGGGSNSEAFKNAATLMGTMGPKIEEKRAAMNEQNQSVAFLEKFAPDIAEKVRAGYTIKEGLAEYKLRAGGGGTEVYGTPIYGKDKDGRTVLGAITKNGKFQPLDTGGIDVTPGVTWQDFGTYKVPFDRSGAPAGAPVPVENFGAARDTAAGSETGKANVANQQALSGMRQTAGRVNMMVEDLKNDKYLPNMIGPVASRLPNVSSDAARVQSKITQLSGEAFLQARQLLKGGGAITDFESKKAEEAMIRLNTAQTEEDFIAALDQFNTMVQQGLQKLEAQVSGASGGGRPAGGATNGWQDMGGGVRIRPLP